MKKTLLLAVMAGAALASCVKNEPIAKGDGSPERILFDAPVVSVPTRAEEIYGNYPKDKDFAVYAIYHTESFVGGSDGTFAGLTAAPATSSMFMTNVKCVANKTGENETPDYWAPETNYYWPKTGMLTFGAYAPSMTNSETGAQKVEWGANGFKFNDFKVDDTPANQIDLLFCDLQKDKKSTYMLTDKPYDGISIPFQHALSSIVFNAKTDVEPGTANSNVKSITLTSITVMNIAKEGDFVQIPTNPGDNKWTIDWATDTDNNDVADVLKDYQILEQNMPLSTSAKPVNGDVDDVGESYDTTEPEQFPIDPENTNDGVRRSDLIVIPQQLASRGETAPNATVVIEYTIVYKNGEKDVTDENTYTYNLGVSQREWLMGKRYVYTITIGLNKITFNPQVQNWTDVPAPDILI